MQYVPPPEPDGAPPRPPANLRNARGERKSGKTGPATPARPRPSLSVSGFIKAVSCTTHALLVFLHVPETRKEWCARADAGPVRERWTTQGDRKAMAAEGQWPKGQVAPHPIPIPTYVADLRTSYSDP